MRENRPEVKSTSADDRAAAARQIIVETGGDIFQGRGVAKQVLGRGLGTLIGNGKIAGTTAASPATVTTTTTATLGRGVGTLIRGVEAKVEAVVPAQAPKRTSAFRAVLRLRKTWFCFAGDVALLALASLVVFLRTGSLNWVGTLLVCILTAGGTALAVWPFWAWAPVETTCLPGEAPKWVLGRGLAGDQHDYVVHLHNPQFVGRVVNRAGRTTIQPVATIAWCQIPRRVGDRLLREAADFHRSQRPK